MDLPGDGAQAMDRPALAPLGFDPRHLRSRARPAARPSPGRIASLGSSKHGCPRTDLLIGRLDDEASVEIRRIAARVIARLAEIFGDRPGVLRSLKEHAERGNIPVPIDLPDYFAVLFPNAGTVLTDDGFDGWQRRADAGVRRLAEQDCANSLPTTSRRSSPGADSQAATAGITYPRHTPHLAAARRRLGLARSVARRPGSEHGGCRHPPAAPRPRWNSSVRVGKQPSNVCSLRIGRLGCRSRSH